MANVIIFGAEGLAKDTYRVILENNSEGNILGFVDEINYDRELFGLPVKNSVYEFNWYNECDRNIVIAVGDPKFKRDIESRLKSCMYTNIINRGTYINKFVSIGIDDIIMGNVTLSCNVDIGNHVCIYSQAMISHDCKIGDYCTIAPGVTICGNVNIGQGCFIGAGTVIKEKVNIVDNVFIGAGSLVLKDIEDEGIYYGTPVKIKNHNKIIS